MLLPTLPIDWPTLANLQALMTDVHTLLQTQSLLSGLGQAGFDALSPLMQPFSFPPGERLFRQGDPANTLLFVCSGSATVHARTPGDDQLVLRKISAGSVLGELALNQPMKRMATVSAEETLTGWSLDIEGFAGLRRQRHPAALHLLRRLSLHLCRRIRRSNATIVGSSDTVQLLRDQPSGESKEPSQKYRKFLGLLPFFADFAESELNELISRMKQWETSRGQIIFTEGSSGTSCFIVVHGAVAITVMNGTRTHRLGVVGPGRMFGEISLIDAGARTATCTAREDAVLLELGVEAFDKLLSSHSTLAFRFIEAINSNLITAQQESNRYLISEALSLSHAISAAELQADESVTAARTQALLDMVRTSVIGDRVVVDGPFGARQVVYADYVASARSLDFIENFIQCEVLPLYANTHTESSGTGLQTSRFREDSRTLIHEACGGSGDDVVVFCGTGATAAIDKLIRVLGIILPQELDERYNLSAQIPAGERPIVFVGPYEHHSNELPWRESIADVVTIPEDANGMIDQAELARQLEEYAQRPLRIGSFSAASNVTGILSDQVGITKLLHRHGALSFWDFAAAGPYVEIDMNPEDEPEASKDAIFLSPHKFMGGPGTPGLLVAKKALFKNRVPSSPGGGTVAFVSPTGHGYLEDICHREESGTPGIVQSIRAGLVFQLKQAIGVDTIQTNEHRFVTEAIEKWQKNENIRILGSTSLERLAVVSATIRHGERLLHWNFVVALLNDLFGIQARGGCSCAGPYGHILFGIGERESELFRAQVTCGLEGIKPGWFRLSFNYFINEEEFNYLVRAVDMIANHGWRLLPFYRFDPQTALWKHVNGRREAGFGLTDLHYGFGSLEYESGRMSDPEGGLHRYLEEADRVFSSAADEARSLTVEPAQPTSEDFESLRWFMMPQEALNELEEKAKGHV